MKNEKLSKINRILAMLEREQDEALADSADVDMEIARVLENAIAGLGGIKSDIENGEFFF